MNAPMSPHDLDERQRQMQTDVLLVATAGVSLLNGMPFSPVLLPFVVLLKALLAGSIIGSPLVVTYLGSFLASATTLVLAGVPAALYERAMGLGRSTPVSLGIWLVGCIVLVAVPKLLIG
jgi:hypothetical protein